MKKMLILFMALILAAGFIPVYAENAGNEELPAYTYSGDDALVGAVADYIAQNTHEYDDSSKVTVGIPAPVILRTVMVDDHHARVYGNFWYMRYEKEGDILVCVSGGENPGIMELEQEDGEWSVVSIETAGDGDQYAEDISRFCDGDKELEDAYFSSNDALQDPLKSIRAQFIRDYVESNALDVIAYQDLYWDPVMLFE